MGISVRKINYIHFVMSRYTVIYATILSMLTRKLYILDIRGLSSGTIFPQDKEILPLQ